MSVSKKRIVVKVGTSTITNESGNIDIRAIDHLCRAISGVENLGGIQKYGGVCPSFYGFGAVCGVVCSAFHEQCQEICRDHKDHCPYSVGYSRNNNCLHVLFYV